MSNIVQRETFRQGDTSKTIYVQIDDLSDNNGLGKTGLAFNTATIICFYTRPLAAAAAITLATQTVTGAWSSGGFVEVDATSAKGLYRFDIPDAVLAVGVDRVYINFQGVADASPKMIMIDLLPAAGSIHAQRATAQKDDTSVTLEVFIQDTRTGLGRTGLAFDTSGLLAYYARAGASAAAITLATLGAANSAWSSGGFKEIDATNMPGLYRLDVPNAVLATGVDRAWVELSGAAFMAPVVIEIDLVTYDPNNIALGAADTIANAVWDELLADHNTAVTMGANQNLIDNLPSSATIVTAVLAGLAPVAGTAQAGGSGTIQLAADESASDDYFNDRLITIVAGTGSGQARRISDYTGATRTATVEGNWATNPSSDSKYIITYS